MNNTHNPPKLIIHAVHGTWPYGLWNQILKRPPARHSSRELPWFANGSSFHKAVAMISGRNLEWVPFIWSGKNSFAARRVAGDEFLKHLFSRLTENRMPSTSSLPTATGGLSRL